MICSECSALIGDNGNDVDTHMKWHEKLNHELARLSRASDPRSWTADPHDAGYRP